MDAADRVYIEESLAGLELTKQPPSTSAVVKGREGFHRSARYEAFSLAISNACD
jgi:hypothetical protein